MKLVWTSEMLSDEAERHLGQAIDGVCFVQPVSRFGSSGPWHGLILTAEDVALCRLSAGCKIVGEPMRESYEQIASVRLKPKLLWTLAIIQGADGRKLRLRVSSGFRREPPAVLTRLRDRAEQAGMTASDGDADGQDER